MAQLRQEHEAFLKLDTVVIVVGPEKAKAFADYWEQNRLPFIGIPDPSHVVLKRYGQQVKIFKFGRMPAQLLVDKEGIVRYVHYGHDMADIPPNQEILGLVAGMNKP